MGTAIGLLGIECVVLERLRVLPVGSIRGGFPCGPQHPVL